MNRIDLINYIKDLFGAKELSKVSVAKIDSYVSSINLQDFIDFAESEILKDEYRYYTPYQKFLAISKKYSKMQQNKAIFAKLEHKQGFVLDLVKKVENFASGIEQHNSMVRSAKELITLENLGKVLVYKETKTPIFTEQEVKALKSVSKDIYTIIELARNKELIDRLNDVWAEKAKKTLVVPKVSKDVKGLLKNKVNRF